MVRIEDLAREEFGWRPRYDFTQIRVPEGG